MASMESTRLRVDLYYEDVTIGDVFDTAAHKVTKADIKAFADATRDHHPLHTDEAHCRKIGFPGVIAHGLYGVSLIEGLKAEMKLYENTSIASLGWDKVRFVKPIYADDIVHARVTFTAKRASKKPDRGVVTEAIQLINQRGEVVTEGEHVTLVLRRAAGA